MRMSLPDQSEGVPPTVRVKVSQLMPSWQRSSPPINPSGALSAPPPTPVPVHANGGPFGLIVPPAGLDAEVFLNAGKTAASAAIRIAITKMRSARRALHEVRVRLANLKIVGIICSAPAVENVRRQGN